jgi:hypothetical protein
MTAVLVKRCVAEEPVGHGEIGQIAKDSAKTKNNKVNAAYHQRCVMGVGWTVKGGTTSNKCEGSLSE